MEVFNENRLGNYRAAENLTCSACGCDTQDHRTFSGNTYCFGCYDSRITNCNDCSTEGDRSDMVQVGSYYYCEPCAEDNLMTCDHCGNYEHEDRAHTTHNDERICDRCYENDFRTCEGCDRVFHYEQMNDYECQECNPQHIRNYSYKPRPEFFRDSANEACVGIELEIRPVECDFKDLAKKSYDLVHPWGYLKEDSSTDGGFEIVTHPHSLSYFKKRKWNEILKELKDFGGRSYEGGYCGLHIHIGREHLSPIDLWKVVTFINECRKPLTKFSFRKMEQLDQWAKFREPLGYLEGAIDNSNRLKVAIKDKRTPRNEQRYSAINITDSTVEFRLFRGTLHYRRFYATVLFVFSLIEYIKGIGYMKLNRNGILVARYEKAWGEYKEFLAKSGRYQFLLDYLNKNKI